LDSKEDQNVNLCLQIELTGSQVSKVHLLDTGVADEPGETKASDLFFDESFYFSITDKDDKDNSTSFETPPESFCRSAELSSGPVSL